MLVKDDVVLAGLQPVMRPVLREANRIWEAHGEELVVTATRDGVHSAASWHPYGYALDLRTRFWTISEAIEVAQELKDALPEYDIIHHTKAAGDRTVTSHIHAEIGNRLAAKLGVLY